MWDFKRRIFRCQRKIRVVTNMREIGSEFWDVPLTNKENKLFPERTQWFLSGRCALQAIINDITIKKCRTVALPSWCCDSMIKPFIDAGIEVSFYPVYWNGDFVQELRKDCDIILIMDYFGYTSKKTDLSNYKGLIIRDTTHSVFTKEYSDADYYFGSFRKWCGIWTGGYAFSNDGHVIAVGEQNVDEYVSLRMKAMELKKGYINFGVPSDKGFLALFNKAEELLEDFEVAPAVKRDIDLLQYLDVKGIKQSRKKNAGILRQALKDWLIFQDMKESDCPLFVPVLVPGHNRDKLRKFLIDHEIYCPVHWPVSKYHKLDKRTTDIYENELSLVCDQRYTEADMDRIIENIKIFWKEL